MIKEQIIKEIEKREFYTDEEVFDLIAVLRGFDTAMGDAIAFLEDAKPADGGTRRRIASAVARLEGVRYA